MIYFIKILFKIKVKVMKKKKILLKRKKVQITIFYCRIKNINKNKL
jgi:hypothetical protein